MSVPGAAQRQRFGSLQFCSRCGDLLPLPGDDDELVCDGCGQAEDATGECMAWHGGNRRFQLSIGADTVTIFRFHDALVCSNPLPSFLLLSFRESSDHHSVESSRVPVQLETEEDQLGTTT